MSELLKALHGHWIVQPCEIVGKLTVLRAIGQWFMETDDRRLANHSQAWMVLASADDAAVEVGRKGALQSLASDGVQLDGGKLRNALVTMLRLVGADPWEASFRRADFGRADFTGAAPRRADFSDADVRGVRGVRLDDASLDCALFCNADLCEPPPGGPEADAFCSDVSTIDPDRVSLANADLRYADLRGSRGLTCEMLASTLQKPNAPSLHELYCTDSYRLEEAIEIRRAHCRDFFPDGCRSQPESASSASNE